MKSRRTTKPARNISTPISARLDRSRPQVSLFQTVRHKRLREIASTVATPSAW